MSIEIAKYTFISWLRRGIANSINQKDTLGIAPSGVNERCTLGVDVSLNGTVIHKDFSLIGPCDVIGLLSPMVVRTSPLDLITNFEPNYLAFIEYYDEDYCWRFTPAAPNGDRLRPWIVLLVLKEADFIKYDSTIPDPAKPLPAKPLFSILVQNKECLPPLDQSWAWAHVHINQGFDHPDAFEAYLETLNNLNDPGADHIVSRLISPRKLEANTNYHAFVVPGFETGRLSGLGQPTAAIDSQKPAWDNATAAGLELPVYYEWFFRTGVMEDFQFLAEQLVPRPMDEHVGIRDMDASVPGFGLDTGTNPSILGLEGALKSPYAQSTVFPILPRQPKDFQTELQAVVNFPDTYRKSTNNSLDPVVSAPIYGQNHALQYTIDVENTGWLNTLNGDPRNRVPAGFGTTVIQKYQEDYVARAWAQVKHVLSMNQTIKFTHVALSVANAFKRRFTDVIGGEQLLLFTGPLLKKVKGSPLTLHAQLNKSLLPPAAMSTAMRRMTRKRGPLSARMKKSGTVFSMSTLINGLNEGKLSAAPKMEQPANLVTDTGLAASLPKPAPPTTNSALFQWLINNRLLLFIIILVVLVLISIFTGALALVIAVAALAVAGFLYLNSQAATVASSHRPGIENGGIGSFADMLTAIKTAPPKPAFRLTMMNPVAVLQTDPATKVEVIDISTSTGANAVHFSQTSYLTANATSGADSLEAVNFRKAATDLYTRLTVVPEVKEKTRFDISNAETKMRQAVEPIYAYSKQLISRYRFPFDPGLLEKPETLVPAMAYPDIKDPMYQPLKGISKELLIPNVSLIPPDTISLLLTNPPFIESYMAGLNHEMGRELLWREYPTDERGSYFRQFWDTKGLIKPGSAAEEVDANELYKDITPMDTWTHASALGNHKKMDLKNPDKKQIVLLIRGELLKRYPNSIIYAQKARPALDAHNKPIPNSKPVITDIVTETDMDTEIKFPLFHAEIEPDIKFFGFDLTFKQASGEEGTPPFTDNLGWFFVIQQMPGEPVFGMEIALTKMAGETSYSWNDVSWDVYDPAKKFIDMNTPPKSSFSPVSDNRNKWGSTASNMAYILYREPVMVAVHASQMLKDLDKKKQ